MVTELYIFVPVLFILLLIYLNSCLIELDGFNNKISTRVHMCSTWPSGEALIWCVEQPEIDSG